MRSARHYILRVRPDGTLRVTIPRGGSRGEGARFLAKHLGWVARERARVRQAQGPVRWTTGTTIMLNGEPVVISIEDAGSGSIAHYGNRSVRVAHPADVRSEIESDLRDLARAQLIPRLQALAAMLGLSFTKVTIRNQRSRWGSCSRKGAIALNFRLVQTPRAVAEYVLIHELVHLQQQNHGRQFWRLVEQACPSFRESERWLRRQGRSLF